MAGYAEAKPEAPRANTQYASKLAVGCLEEVADADARQVKATHFAGSNSRWW